MTFEPIDIFDDSYNYDLFCHLDKNNDGLISKSDFVHLFEGIYLIKLENGIE
jgi:Ca2+-binding EF-hand superfamily protein